MHIELIWCILLSDCTCSELIGQRDRHNTLRPHQNDLKQNQLTCIIFSPRLCICGLHSLSYSTHLLQNIIYLFRLFPNLEASALPHSNHPKLKVGALCFITNANISSETYFNPALCLIDCLMFVLFSCRLYSQIILFLFWK